MGLKFIYVLSTTLLILVSFMPDDAAAILRCEQSKAHLCTYNALKKAETVNCDWEQVMPDYVGCVRQWVEGCHTMAQQWWIDNVMKFNKTLQTIASDPNVPCSDNCAGNTAQEQAVDTCATASGGYDQLIATLEKEGPTGANVTEECAQIESIIACMQAAVSCPKAVVYKDLKVAQFTPVAKYCNVVTPVIAPEPYNYTILAIVLGVVALIIGLNIVLILIFLYDRRQRIKSKEFLNRQAPSISPTTYYQRPRRF